MYQRVLLKLSGEALHEDEGSHTIDVECLEGLAKVICMLHEKGIQVAIVIGAGNIWRGKLASRIGIEPVPADFMGMLGTVINAVALASCVRKYNVDSIVYSAIPAIDGVTLPYSQKEADEALSNGSVVFLAGGTGKPFYTTDTAAALRAIELNCQAIFMGKNGVQGVYTADPTINKDAEFISEITFAEMIKRNLQIMDISAIQLIKDKDIDVRVFSMSDPLNFLKVAEGQHIGTICKKGE